MVRRRLPLAAAAVLASAGVAACGSSSNKANSNAAGLTGAAAIQRAADVSGAAKGYKIAATITSTAPSIGRITVNENGTFNVGSRQGQMNMTMKMPGLANLSPGASMFGNLPLQIVLDNTSFYIRVPSQLSGLLGNYIGSKPWVSINLDSVGKAAGIPGLSSMLSSTGADPSQYLKQLQAEAKSVTKVGTATVNGANTTEYKAELDFSHISKNLPANQRAAVQKALGTVAKTLGNKPLTEYVWVDSANLVRRVKFSYSQTIQGQKLPFTGVINFLAYGAQPAPTIPSASQVFSLDGLLSKAAQGGGASSLLGG